MASVAPQATQRVRASGKIIGGQKLADGRNHGSRVGLIFRVLGVFAICLPVGPAVSLAPEPIAWWLFQDATMASVLRRIFGDGFAGALHNTHATAPPWETHELARGAGGD